MAGTNGMRVKVAVPNIGDEDLKAVSASLLSGQLTSGPQVQEFERRFADFVGTRHAVAVNSGTAAIHAALAGIGLRPGEEVIVPALTFFSTATAVIHQGGVPIFCDISPVTFSMDPDDLENRISPRTKALIAVHYMGHSAEMDRIMEVARQHDLKVIEDCAQSHGTTYKGAMTGSIGDCGAFSFFATKHMTTCEGGMITTDNSDVAEYMRKFRSHGLDGRNDHILLGYNYRMPDPLGALGISQLARLKDSIARRIEVSERMIAAVRGIPWLSVPEVPDYVRHTYFWCHIRVDENKLGMRTSELIDVLKKKGIEVRNRYTEPLYRQPLLTSQLPPILKLVAGDKLPDYSAMHLANAEAIAGRIIGLPNRNDISDAEIDYVADVLRGL